MRHYNPDFAQFTTLSDHAPCVPIYRQLTGDGLTPVSAYLKIAATHPAFLFESVVGGERVSRYSFLGTNPFLRFEARGETVTIRLAPHAEWPPLLLEDFRSRVPVGNGVAPRELTFVSKDPFADLQAILDRHPSLPLAGLPRFLAGAVGFASYDAVRYTENLPNAPPDDRGLPDLAFGFYDQMVIFDHIFKTILVVGLAHGAGDLRSRYDAAVARIDALVDRLAAPARELPLQDIETRAITLPEPRSNMTQAQFEAIVRKCQEYIQAGDIFQVVPSQRFAVDTQADPFAIYRALRIVNPSPFLFFVDQGDYQLIGSSPELMVRIEDRAVTIRPLAGTRKRGRDEAEDAALEIELLADPKERAEHIMLIDLARNDVGRVADVGSVQLTETMKIERYSHVMHISSNVRGTLQPEKTAFDALRAALPVGTVSGAPKIRAMEIIDEVEPQRRGPYAGAVGYFDLNGNSDTCIALRTIVMQGKTAYVQAGCGVVYDSVPADEYAETVAKARGLLTAIAIAESQLSPNEKASGS